MKILIHDASDALLAEHELNAENARKTLAEFSEIPYGGSKGEGADGSDGQYAAQDVIHLLRRCARGTKENPAIKLTITDSNGVELGTHELTSNSARFALETLDCGDGYEPKLQAEDEVAGKFAGQELIHMLRRCGRGVVE